MIIGKSRRPSIRVAQKILKSVETKDGSAGEVSLTPSPEEIEYFGRSSRGADQLAAKPGRDARTHTPC